jgi:hypothetical protein
VECPHHFPHKANHKNANVCVFTRRKTVQQCLLKIREK